MGVENSKNFLPNLFGGYGDMFKALGDEITGHSKEGARAWANAQIGWGNALGEPVKSPILSKKEQTQKRLQQEQDNLNRATDPNANWNAQNWKSLSGNVTKASYSNQAGLSGTVKPTDLLSISDPNTKVINSTVRGKSKTLFKVAKNELDTASSSSIQKATVGNPAPSETINSAGGDGLTISQDTQGVSSSLTGN